MGVAQETIATGMAAFTPGKAVPFRKSHLQRLGKKGKKTRWKSCSLRRKTSVRFLWPFKLLNDDGYGSKIINDFSTEAIEDSSHHLPVAQFQSSGKGKTSEIQKTAEKKTSFWNCLSP